MSKMHIIAQQLALGVVIVPHMEASRRRHEEPELIIIDEAIAAPPGIPEAAEHLMQLRMHPIEDPQMKAFIQPNDRAGDSWRRQGKRRGNPRR